MKFKLYLYKMESNQEKPHEEEKKEITNENFIGILFH